MVVVGCSADNAGMGSGDGVSWGLALGQRGNRPRQEARWVARERIGATPGHACSIRLAHRRTAPPCDLRVDHRCRRVDPGPLGRPRRAPGVSCRGRRRGDCAGRAAARGSAWRGADARARRTVLGYGVAERTPDHATRSRTRRVWWTATPPTVVRWVRARVPDAGRLTGPTIGRDATTVAAKAAMRSIGRRDTGATAAAYRPTLAQAAGRETPTRAALARGDRPRPPQGSPQDGRRPADPEARRTRRTAGRTPRAHPAEPAGDGSRGARRAIPLPAADRGATTPRFATLRAADAAATAVDWGTLAAVVRATGDHRGAGKAEEPRPGSANRRGIRGPRTTRRPAQRAELNERSHAPLDETGRMRRGHLRGREHSLQRRLIPAAGFNRARIRRARSGGGTPRGRQGRSVRSVWHGGPTTRAYRRRVIARPQFIATLPCIGLREVRVSHRPVTA